jgi:hypothetical protein
MVILARRQRPSVRHRPETGFSGRSPDGSSGYSEGEPMLVEKTVEVPAHTRTETDFIECELCKSRTINDHNWGHRERGSYHVDWATIKLERGSNYPEGASITTTIVDMCPDCFEQKLIPWIRSQGGSPREIES